MPLEPPAFLPLSCCLASFERHARLLDGRTSPSRGAADVPWRLCYLTSEMARLLPAAMPLLNASLEWTYREQLVVLATHREHPRVQALVEQLRQVLVALPSFPHQAHQGARFRPEPPAAAIVEPCRIATA